jgi:hypothetical protein
MSVLPQSTTFYSFFIVLSGFLVITIILAAFLPLMRSLFVTYIFPSLQRTIASTKALPERSGITSYSREIINIVIHDPTHNEVAISDRTPEWFQTNIWGSYTFYRAMRFMFRNVPILIVNQLLVQEMKLPKKKWALMQSLNHKYFPSTWKVLYFLADIVRFSLLPIWATLIVVVLLHVVVLDTFLWIIWLFLRVVYLGLYALWCCCCCLRTRN